MPETARLLGLSNPSAEGSRAGREVLRWLAQPHILNIARARFDTLLLEIAEYAEEWFTGAQAMRLADRLATNRKERGDPSPGPTRLCARRGRSCFRPGS